METWQDLFYNYLEKRYLEVQRKNPRFSKRAFARMGKVSPPAMMALLKRSNDWNLSPERAHKILENIGAPVKKVNRLLAITNQKLSFKKNEVQAGDYDIFADWTFLPVLFSFDLFPKKSVAEIAAHFGITQKKVEQVIEALVQKGLLATDADGTITRDENQHLSTPDGMPNTVLRDHHLANLNAVATAVKKLDIEKRDITSMTFSGDSQKLAEVRQEIRRFHERIFTIMDDSDSKDEVFRIVVGVAPVHASTEGQD